MNVHYSINNDVVYPSDYLHLYSNLPDDLIVLNPDQYQVLISARAQSLPYLFENSEFIVAPSAHHEYDKKTKKWVLNEAKKAEVDAQAEQKAVESVKHALQAHIDAVAIGLGFSGGNAVMLYAGFANAFQSLAQSFGAWEADIWAQANQYMAQVKSGDAPMLTPEQAVERIPAFEFTGA